MSLPSNRPAAPVPSSRSRILHLGFQDFRQPGSGGGAVRTHEINKRLVTDYDITVLTSRYPGSEDRVEDGVRYLHIGRSWGYFGSMLTYFAAVPIGMWKHRADLVVEDFAAPFSSCLSPLWTRRKIVAMVQWLNAKEKSKQYHLPFWLVEKLGLRLHRNYIAVSGDLADKIRAGSKRAHVDVVGNGVPSSAFDVPLGRTRKDIVFLGRLEKEQKGLDLLLDAFAAIADRTDAQLRIVGDGPDLAWMTGRIAELGIADRVDLVGRREGSEKYDELATAKVVAMPSRFETFGMVAIEAFAVGAPVVAFEIPCLQEVVPSALGDRVPAFDVNALAKALLAQLESDGSERELPRREFARRYDWDTLAAQQGAIYARELGS